MDNVINEYQKWKQQGESLRSQARHAMESRYRELLIEAVRIAQEYHADFGAPLKPPPPVTTFRFKAGAKAKGKPGGRPKAAPPAAPAAKTPAASKPDPKAAGIEKKLATVRKKLEAARAAGTPTRNHEDRIYELEDELRLAHESA